MSRLVHYAGLWTCVKSRRQIARLGLRNFATVSQDTFIQVVRAKECYELTFDMYGIPTYTPVPALWAVH